MLSAKRRIVKEGVEHVARENPLLHTGGDLLPDVEAVTYLVGLPQAKLLTLIGHRLSYRPLLTATGPRIAPDDMYQLYRPAI